MMLASGAKCEENATLSGLFFAWSAPVMAKVSIVVAAWRAADTIGRAIASARAQTLTDIEIVIVNDCSPDDTIDAARRAAGDDVRVKFLEMPRNSGPAGARNAGFDAASGEWIAVLDADDFMAPERLENLMAFADAQQADIVADDLAIADGEGETAGARHLGLAGPMTVSLADYARANFIFDGGRKALGYLKPIFRTAFLRQHGLRYDPCLRIGEDYDLVASALAKGARYAILPEALYSYVVHEGSISRRLSRAHVAALIAADDHFMKRFAGALDRGAAVALQARRANLEDAAAFLLAVEALKARDYSSAFAALLRRPASIRHFGMPIGARVARLTARFHQDRK
jgi:succinoglycan biosynthesis protein ExoO